MQLAPVAPARAANTGAAVNLRELRAAVNTGAVNTGAAAVANFRAANTAAAVNLGELRAGYAARDCFTAAVANSAPSIPPAPSTPAPPPWPTSAPPIPPAPSIWGNSARESGCS